MKAKLFPALLCLTMGLSIPFLQAADKAKPKEATVVISEGVGINADKALLKALRNAVQQVVGVIIDAETLIKNEKVVKDEILGNGPPSLDDFLTPKDDFLKPEVGKVEEKLTDINEAISRSADGVQLFKNNAGGKGVVARAEHRYLAEAILQSVGDFAAFVHGQAITSEDKISESRYVAKTAARVGTFNFSVLSEMETMTTDAANTKSLEKNPKFNSRTESSNEYKVEGKTGSLIARFGYKIHDTSESLYCSNKQEPPGKWPEHGGLRRRSPQGRLGGRKQYLYPYSDYLCRQ